MQYERNIDFESVTLRLMEEEATLRLPLGLFDRRFSVTAIAEGVASDLVARIRVRVLSEQAGPIAEDRVVYDAVNFPWWIPKWLRRRWTRTKTLTLRVRPVWTYPCANLPDLQSARRRWLYCGTDVLATPQQNAD